MSEPTRMQREVRAEVLSYGGSNSFMLSLKRQAASDHDWYPTREDAQRVVRLRGGGVGAVGQQARESSKRQQAREAERLGSPAEHAEVVGHVMRRRGRNYPHHDRWQTVQKEKR